MTPKKSDPRMKLLMELVKDGVFEEIPSEPPLYRLTKSSQTSNITQLLTQSHAVLSHHIDQMTMYLTGVKSALDLIQTNVPLEFEELGITSSDVSNEETSLTPDAPEDLPATPRTGQYL